MHEKLKHPPVTYVLAQVKFSNIESIERYVAELQEEIRGEFPLFNKIKVDMVQIHPNVSPIASSTINWHFMDKASVLGVLLDNNSITIHTSKYLDFTSLSEQFEDVLTRFNKKLKIAVSTRIGLRYVNLIPSNVINLVKPELLGLCDKNNPALSLDKFFSKTEVTQESNLGTMNIKSLYFANKEIMKGIINSKVTPELSQLAQFLSFAHHKEVVGESLILDIDHFQIKNTDFSVKNIISQLKDLQEVIYQMFCFAVTNNAIGKFNETKE